MSASARSLVDVEQVRAGVDAALTGHVAALADELTPLGPDAATLVDAVTLMLGGGKRLRAAFCYWSWRAHGGIADEPGPGEGQPGTSEAAPRAAVLRVGAALELFQAAALFHDDVMDDSDTRRGRPTAHRSFARRHADQRWSGSSASFGGSAAILLGDLALIASEREFAGATRGLGASLRADALAVFDQMRTEVTVGQYLDVLAQTRPWGRDLAADEDRARAVLRAKSARYSVEHPLVLGAMLAGARPDELARLRRIGLPVGEAFQLRDDLLGVFGDPSATGKPAGDDLREGKRTVLVIRALARAAPQDRSLLTDRLGATDLAPGDIEELQRALERSGAVRSVETLIEELASPALAELAAAPLADPGRSMLLDLARAAVHRQS